MEKLWQEKVSDKVVRGMMDWLMRHEMFTIVVVSVLTTLIFRLIFGI